MNYVANIEEKIEFIRNQFSPLIGRKVRGYELAQLWCEDECGWDFWMDLPVFLSFDDATLSISWKNFDELAIAYDRCLPFSLEGSTVRWVCEGVSSLDSAIGKTLSFVSIGRGEMSIEEKEVEIWTRLLIGFEGGNVLEIYNALDENGIEFHQKGVLGESRKCI
ncbi:hypothetical protein [Thalassolituus sp. C2-1]|uniref:hypothetical protein n=1 Tax=Venatorbacter sp. C2-1 TaxID=2597518 RepID=UPI001192B90F|nr:hypothetical protein [Thalassolituus sp. C2-1]TVV45496.1 hypothetical protein FOT50_01260 [Thalassolituus sp. C2-1]